MRDKLIDALDGAMMDHVGFVSLDATIKFADQLIAEGRCGQRPQMNNL